MSEEKEKKEEADNSTQPAVAESEKKEGESKKGELEICQREKEEYLNGWRRTKADLENYKKEETARAEMTVKFSNELLVGELVAILDSLDLAIKTEPENKGTRLIRDQLGKILLKYGLTEIKAVAGEKFNPARHEAVETVTVKEGEETGIIVEVIGSGWKLYETVLRPVRVKVYK